MFNYRSQLGVMKDKQQCYFSTMQHFNFQSTLSSNLKWDKNIYNSILKKI